MHATGNVIAAAAAAALAGSALAANELQIDINSLTTEVMGANPVGTYPMDSVTPFVSPDDEITRGSGFSTSFTGSIALSDDSNSVLNGILIGGVAQAFSGTLMDFVGQIDFVSGAVTGGNFLVTVLEGDNVTQNTYAANIVAGSGQINTQAGQGFSIDGLTYQGFFSSAVFAGVDVTLWDDNEPLSGSFIEFQFDPDAQGIDDESDIDIFVVVPLPTAPALAGVGLLGLAAGTRRRRLA